MTNTNRHSIEDHREHYLQGLEFKESVLQRNQESAWNNHPKFECFVCTSLNGLNTITDLKLLRGYKPIDEPLARGVYPDGRYYQYLLKAEDVLKDEKAQLDEKVRQEYLRDLEERATKGLDDFIESVLLFPRQ